MAFIRLRIRIRPQISLRVRLRVRLRAARDVQKYEQLQGPSHMQERIVLVDN